MIVLTCGIPGSGKSTWAKKKLANYDYYRHVSRDDIRFSLVEEGAPYFSKEKEVFKKFVDQICEFDRQGFDVIADATHVSKASRKKLINAVLAQNPDAIFGIAYFNVPYDECLERNNFRLGTKKFVPLHVMAEMFRNLEVPSVEEDNILMVFRP